MSVVIEDHLLQIEDGMLALVFRSHPLSPVYSTCWLGVPFSIKTLNKIALNHWRFNFYLEEDGLCVCSRVVLKWLWASSLPASFRATSGHCNFAGKTSLRALFWNENAQMLNGKGYTEGDKVVICVERAYVGGLTGHIPDENWGFCVWLFLSGAGKRLFAWWLQLNNSTVKYQ